MLRFLMSLTGNPPTAGFTAKFRVILSAVRAGYIGPGRGLQRCVGIFLSANRRFHVHERTEEPEPSRVPAAAGDCRAGHLDRRDRPWQPCALGGITVMPAMIY